MKFHEWITEKHLENQDSLESGVIAMDVEDLKASYYDMMRMAGKIVISCESQSFQRHLDDQPVSGLLEDCWKQTPGKIMFSDGLSWCWCVIISLPYWRRLRSREDLSPTSLIRSSQRSPYLYWSRSEKRCCGD